MQEYKKRLAVALAETGALFFDEGLVLKDGRPTPYFVNLAMFRTGRLALELGGFFADMIMSKGLSDSIDVILGPSYKGSAIALATSAALYKNHGLDMPFEYDRKEAKTHGEASSGGNVFVNQSLFDGCRIFVVDDVATSMGTKYELLEKILLEGRNRNMRLDLTGIGIAVDREQTNARYDDRGTLILGQKGKNAIKNFMDETEIPVHSVAGIREVVDYLYQEKIPVRVKGEMSPLDDGTYSVFQAYLDTYGVC